MLFLTLKIKNMKLLLSICLIAFFCVGMKSQNNHIVRTEDGRRVLLKADFTWEYIDLTIPEKQPNTPTKEASNENKIEGVKNNINANYCNLGSDFNEPKLNTKTQALLKRSRSSIKQLKEKVAKKENCAIREIILISASETKAKGTYTFCTCNGKIAYKRNGSSFFRKKKLF